MSQLYVDNIRNRTGGAVGAPSGINVTGVSTITGDLNITGVLTYEDVANVDSVGVITARSGVNFGTTAAGTLVSGDGTGIGIGTASPDKLFHVQASDAGASSNSFDVAILERNDDCYLKILSANNKVGGINFGDAQGSYMGALYYDHTPNALIFNVNESERLRIDSSGRILQGLTSAKTGFFNDNNAAPVHQIQGSTYYTTAFSIFRDGSGASGPNFILAKGREAIVQDDDTLGTFSFQGHDGTTELVEGAKITGEVDGTPGANDMPSRLVFSTTADGAALPTERLRVDSSGRMLIGATDPVAGADTNGLLQVSQDVDNNTCIIVAENTASSGNLSCFRARLRNSAPDSIFSAFLQCDDSSAGSKAVIRSNGGLANFSANNANLSDRNTKKDITLAADTWNSIKNWEIVNFRYKEQPDDADLNLGVIAQQIEEVSPEMVIIFQEAKEATETEPAREQRLGVREQQMQWMATKALQEAMARIEELEAKVAALEGS